VDQQVSTTAEIARNTTLAATGTNRGYKSFEAGSGRRFRLVEMLRKPARVAAEEVSVQTEAWQREIDSLF